MNTVAPTTVATISALGRDVEGFEDAVSSIPGILSYEVQEDVDEYGYYVEAQIRVSGFLDDVSDTVHDHMNDWGLSGTWSQEG